MDSIIRAIVAWPIECIPMSIDCFYVDVNRIVYIDRASYVGIDIAANNIHTLSTIFTPEVVLDYKQPYSHGAYLYPKQLRVKEL